VAAPSIGHVAVGLAAARLAREPRGLSPLAWRLGLVAASLLPDADVVAFTLGIPYHAPLGHRGASHSLAVAGLCGLLSAALGRIRGVSPTRIGVLAGVVMATHGLLDTLTDGGLGIALLWPWSNARLFAPWRPIPVAPIGAGMLSWRGLEVLFAELILFLPVFVIGLWPRGARAPSAEERSWN
jgi:inner membrane protein